MQEISIKTSDLILEKEILPTPQKMREWTKQWNKEQYNILMQNKDLINLIPENLIEASKLAEKILGINKKN